ncbi:MAG TPA: substrate-binding domain-containing protein [Anaerovoracaceae bacterium]|nr:substrate-binding domain-containing protein [Anaerovoracaceae bacterium]
MKNILVKVLICIIFAAALIFAGLFAALIVALSGGALFYSPLILTCVGVLIVFIILKVFALIKPKLFKILFLSFLGLCILAVGGYEINTAWHNSLAEVNEQGVDLELYKPFAENTKAVSLEEESTLKIENNLPRLDGATALYPLYSAFAQAVYPAGDYDIYAAKGDNKEESNQDQGEVACSNTINAYTRLMNGEADIIFTARPSEQQLAEAQSRGLELKLTPIGKEAFVFFVNSRNRVNGLTTSQIQDIYSGKITNWQEAGGKNEKIRAFQRPENSGSQTMLQKLMEGKDLMTPPTEDIASGMGDIIEQTASYRNYKNAIGYSFLFFATEMIQNNEIKLLEVDGAKPDKNTIASGEYPLAAEFYAVTVAGSDTPGINDFIQWILSPQGQYLVEKTGYTPLNTPAA